MFIYFQTNPDLKIPEILKLSMLRKIRMGWFNPTSVFLNLPKVDGSFDWGNSSSSDTPKDHIDHIVGFICWVYMQSYCINIFMIFHEISMNCLGFIPQLAHKPCHDSWGCQQWRHAPHWTAPFESLALRSGAMVHHRKIMKNPRGVSGIQQYDVYTYHIHIFTYILYTRKNISMMVGVFIASLGWSEGSIFLDVSQKSVPNLWVDHHFPWIFQMTSRPQLQFSLIPWFFSAGTWGIHGPILPGAPAQASNDASASPGDPTGRSKISWLGESWRQGVLKMRANFPKFSRCCRGYAMWWCL